MCFKRKGAATDFKKCSAVDETADFRSVPDCINFTLNTSSRASQPSFAGYLKDVLEETTFDTTVMVNETTDEMARGEPHAPYNAFES